MRKITMIILHCSANKEGSTLRATDIDRLHRSRGWNGCGYHYVIPTDGTLEIGRAEVTPGAHCLHHNEHSIGVCYIGGLDEFTLKPKDTRTPQQRFTMRRLLESLHRRYPEALILSHHDLEPMKACPCFSVEEYADLQP